MAPKTRSQRAAKADQSPLHIYEKPIRKTRKSNKKAAQKGEQAADDLETTTSKPEIPPSDSEFRSSEEPVQVGSASNEQTAITSQEVNHESRKPETQVNKLVQTTKTTSIASISLHAFLQNLSQLGVKRVAVEPEGPAASTGGLVFEVDRLVRELTASERPGSKRKAREDPETTPQKRAKQSTITLSGGIYYEDGKLILGGVTDEQAMRAEWRDGVPPIAGPHAKVYKELEKQASKKAKKDQTIAARSIYETRGIDKQANSRLTTPQTNNIPKQDEHISEVRADINNEQSVATPTRSSWGSSLTRLVTTPFAFMSRGRRAPIPEFKAPQSEEQTAAAGTRATSQEARDVQLNTPTAGSDSSKPDVGYTPRYKVKSFVPPEKIKAASSTATATAPATAPSHKFGPRKEVLERRRVARQAHEEGLQEQEDEEKRKEAIVKMHEAIIEAEVQARLAEALAKQRSLEESADRSTKRKRPQGVPGNTPGKNKSYGIPEDFYSDDEADEEDEAVDDQETPSRPTTRRAPEEARASKRVKFNETTEELCTPPQVAGSIRSKTGTPYKAGKLPGGVRSKGVLKKISMPSIPIGDFNEKDPRGVHIVIAGLEPGQFNYSGNFTVPDDSSDESGNEQENSAAPTTPSKSTDDAGSTPHPARQRYRISEEQKRKNREYIDVPGINSSRWSQNTPGLVEMDPKVLDKLISQAEEKEERETNERMERGDREEQEESLRQAAKNAPPAAPQPAHATLPATPSTPGPAGGNNQNEALSKARERATQFTPKQPSRLREATVAGPTEQSDEELFIGHDEVDPVVLESLRGVPVPEVVLYFGPAEPDEDIVDTIWDSAWEQKAKEAVGQWLAAGVPPQ